MIAFCSVENSLPKFTTVSNASTFVPSAFIVLLISTVTFGVSNLFFCATKSMYVAIQLLNETVNKSVGPNGFAYVNIGFSDIGETVEVPKLPVYSVFIVVIILVFNSD